jgi:hypothetical protein
VRTYVENVAHDIELIFGFTRDPHCRNTRLVEGSNLEMCLVTGNKKHGVNLLWYARTNGSPPQNGDYPR